ncbi:MAG: MFS transporter [Christensenellaceae bacterium]|nr:MFS transporter [Christensenellaceae bacterium]
MKKRPSFYYGWVVALCCSLLALSINAMGNNSLSFYVAPLSEALGASRAAINFSVFTVGAIVRTLLGFFYGAIVKRTGIKPLMWFGCLLAVAAYVVFSLADGLLVIGIASGLYGMAHALGTFSAYNAIINHWFIRRKGLVLGLVNTSVGLGGMIINPLASRWIASAGWNASFLYTALLMAVIAIPSLFFVKISPGQKGLAPYGAQDAPAAADPAPASAAAPMQLADAMKTLRFWMIAALQFLVGFSVGQSFSMLVPHLNAIHMDPVFLSGTLSVLFALGTTLATSLPALFSTVSASARCSLPSGRCSWWASCWPISCRRALPGGCGSSVSSASATAIPFLLAP